jgi:hypothetical protein
MLKSKTGDFAGIPMPEDAVFIKYQMLQPVTGFLPVEEDDIVFRNVLYWSPFENNDLEKHHTFYTSHHLADYEIIIKGYSDDGGFFEERKTFSVRK